MDPRIHELIEQKLIGAIALDTSIFDGQQGRLEDGLLRRVEQFRSTRNVAVLMPDVVQRELIVHLTRDAAAARTALLRATRAPDLVGLLSPAALTQLQTRAAQAIDPADAATARVTRWLELTDATVLNVAEHVDLRALFDRYFAMQPPFAEAGKKKHEFPDAAALLALESWANARSTGILVVSSDKDWHRFCAGTNRLYCTADLGDALGAFQDETAQFAARRLAELSGPGGPINLAAAMLDALRTSFGAIQVHIEASSGYAYDWKERIDLERVELPVPEIALTEFEAVDYGDGAVTVAVHGTAHGRISIYCAFCSWSFVDGVEDTYTELGTRTFNCDAAIAVRALVTLTGDIPKRFKIGAVEILPTVHRVELGQIEPDWLSLLGDNLTPPHQFG
ncbi:PIN domain-containing protein [Burkholderia sp. WTPI3]|uniref:PIN domain-containing protein n=1 Tax=Burkholderia sp. WTPI3 TaxID=2822167 RepID=UPI001F15E7DB|nr:PIN domain-containing protein [Burkholderia sp. WTPI3]